MHVREYESDDLTAVQRIWRECGWVDEDEAAQIGDFLADADVVVAEVDGAAEACTSVHDGTIQHTGTSLPTAVVSSVTTSRVGRRQGLARATLTESLRRAARGGAAVSVLGMFEQGFYDQAGFGTGTEMTIFRLDPGSLSDRLPYRRPVRLSLDDIPDMVACLTSRDLAHGAVTIPSTAMRRADRSWDEGGFGLGYRDQGGTLTHFLWCSTKGEWGPYNVREWAWRSTDQLLELLGLLRSLGDQVRTIELPEPAQVQLQVLLHRPVRMKIARPTGEHRVSVRASAWWQARVMAIEPCVTALRASRALHCNLRITDPLDLPGVAGEWILHLGEQSEAVRGHDEDLSSTLETSVGAFTRLWLGVRPATTLAATDDLHGTAELLDALDDAIRLPRPDVSMGF